MRKYFFQIKRCGDAACRIRGRPTLPPEQFAMLKDFPDPVMAADGVHYKSLEEVWDTATTEAHRPSMKATTDPSSAPAGRKVNSAKASHSTAEDNTQPLVAPKKETVREFISCAECEKRRCVFAS